MAVDIDIQVKGNAKALEALTKLTEEEKKLKEAFDATNKKYKETEISIKQLKEEIRKLDKQKQEAFDPKEVAVLNGRIEATKNKIKEINKIGFTALQQEIKETSNEIKTVETGLGRLSKSLRSMKQAAISYGITQILKQTATEVAKSVAQFQRLEATLTTALGSRSRAREALNNIQDFASNTPFQVTEIAESFNRLANRIQGIQFDNNQFTALGDLASATGVEIDQLIEAILDVNNTERWNELGIKVRTEGNRITATFKGVTQTFDRSEQGALQMAQAFGQIEGVAGGMALQSETLGGKLSNLQDNFENLKLEAGKRLSDAMNTAIDGMNRLTQSASDFIAIPMSEQLREEQTELNVLVNRITDTNATQETRNSLISELQVNYPNFLGNLNAETVSNQQLSQRLSEVNELYVQKIILQKEEEKIKKAAEQLADAQVRTATQQVNIDKLLTDANQKFKLGLDLTNKTLEERKQSVLGALDVNAKFYTSIRTGVTTAVNEEAKAYQKINRVRLSEIVAVGKQQKAQENLTKTQNNRAALLKQLGIDEIEINKAFNEFKGNEPTIPTAINKSNEAKKQGNDLEKEALALAKAKRDITESEINFLLKKNAIAQEDAQGKDLRDLLNQEFELRLQLIELKRQEQVSTAKLDEEKQLANQNAKQSVELLKEELNQRKTVTQLANLETVSNEQIVSAELKKINDKQLEDFKKNLNKKQELLDAANRRQIEKERTKQAVLQELEQVAVSVISDLQNAYFENKLHQLDTELQYAQTQKEQELLLVGDSEAGKAEAQKRFDEKRKKIELEKAKQQRKQALYQIAIDTAINAVKLFSQTVPPGILSAIAVAQGAIQAGIVASRPLPKFRDGTEWLNRGNNPIGIDTIPAMLNEGERIVPTHINKQLLGIKNEDLPPLIKFGLALKDFPMVRYDLPLNNQEQPDIENMIKRAVNEAVKNQTKHITTWDEKGVQKWIVEGQNKTKKLNNLFKL